jgi:hypothetical protein
MPFSVLHLIFMLLILRDWCIQHISPCLYSLCVDHVQALLSAYAMVFPDCLKNPKHGTVSLLSFPKSLLHKLNITYPSEG